ncbi:MAG: hypothetical protein IJ910_03295 [Bacteroidaceae bacterium]|nr:hypothetical protein [Bacteroidaceae bacterium]
MFDIKGDIHDRYTLEFKIGYTRSDENVEVSDFVMDTWLFLPDSMNINQGTYTKDDFYRDFRAMLRLITPVFSLEEIANPNCLPLTRLKTLSAALAKDINSKNEKAYEHQIKMFCNIVRSAYRDELLRISRLTNEDAIRESIEKMLVHIRAILKQYRAIPDETGISMLATDYPKWFRLGDEWLCLTFDVRTYNFLVPLKKRLGDKYESVARELGKFLDEQKEYERNHHFLQPQEKDQAEHNRRFLHRAGQLKKYVESDLYLLAHTKSNTFVLQQILFMLAAGVSMVFATVISFSFQKTFGNFTMPLFIALVVSYMFKDRIKELMRFWFAQKLGSKIYDFKTTLALSEKPIGWIKRGMDFVNESKLPSEVRKQRGRTTELETGNTALREQVIIFRQHLSMYGKKLSTLSHYPLHGVNEILRVNLREFLRHIDSSHVPIYVNDGDAQFHEVQVEKVYHLHFIIRVRYEGTESFRRFSVCLNRRGAISIEED